MTRTTSEIFAPAIANANRLASVHKIIQMWQQPYRGQRIARMFESGRINGTDQEMLLDLYVSEA